MHWIDAVWSHDAAQTVMGRRSGLTLEEKKILLAYAQGCDHYRAADAIKVAFTSFKTSYLERLRAKLHASDVRRMLKVGYEMGALALDRIPPTGVEIPKDYLDVLLLLLEGNSNQEIHKLLGRPESTVRTQVNSLARGLMVVRGQGSRSQLAARCFELGIVTGADVIPASD